MIDQLPLYKLKQQGGNNEIKNQYWIIKLTKLAFLWNNRSSTQGECDTGIISQHKPECARLHSKEKTV